MGCQISVFISKVALQDFLETFDKSKLHRNLCSDTYEGKQHALVESESSLFGDSFFDGMNISLVVLLRFGNHLDFDVFERHHAEDLTPA